MEKEEIKYFKSSGDRAVLGGCVGGVEGGEQNLLAAHWILSRCPGNSCGRCQGGHYRASPWLPVTLGGTGEQASSRLLQSQKAESCQQVGGC